MTLKLFFSLAVAIMMTGQVQSQTQSQIEELEAQVKTYIGNPIGVWMPKSIPSETNQGTLNAGPRGNMAYALMQVGLWRMTYEDNPEYTARENYYREKEAAAIKACGNAVICVRSHPNRIGEKRIPRYVARFTDIAPSSAVVRTSTNGLYVYLRAGVVTNARLIEIAKVDSPNCDWDVRIRMWFSEQDTKKSPVLKAWSLITERDGFDQWMCFAYGQSGPFEYSSRGVFE